MRIRIIQKLGKRYSKEFPRIVFGISRDDDVSIYIKIPTVCLHHVANLKYDLRVLEVRIQHQLRTVRS